MNEHEATDVHAGPVTKVARHLTEIIELSHGLEDQAIAKANATLMPGGLPMVALANVASLDEWAELIEAAEHRHQANPDRFAYPDIEDDDEWEPPLQTLRYWSEQWRQHHGMSYSQRATLGSEANFLRWALDWAWDNETRWDNFADDVHQARIRLEGILYAGRRPEKTRVICDRDYCEKHPRLIKVYAPRTADSLVCPECNATYQTDSETHCRLCDQPTPLETVWVSDPADDRHKCPSCKTYFDADDFRRAHAQQLRSEGAEKFLPLIDAIGTLKVHDRPERTVRKWLEAANGHTGDVCVECENRFPASEYSECPDCSGDLAPVTESGDGVQAYRNPLNNRVHVWWPDLWTLHLSTQTRGRGAA